MSYLGSIDMFVVFSSNSIIAQIPMQSTRPSSKTNPNMRIKY
jgi:hypothetical protein